jgi:predicted transcriptional regulator YheO
VPFDDFNKNHHGANDRAVELSALNNIGLIQKNMYPVVIHDEADLAREIARIANRARQLALKIRSENRDMTQDEAYTELSHSASLLRAVLSYAKEKK